MAKGIKIEGGAMRYVTVIPLIAALLLAGCFEEQKLKADTESHFATSYDAMTNGLSRADRDKLDSALKDIVLAQVGLYGPMFEAKTYHLPSSEPGSALGQAFANNLTNAMGAAISQGWSLSRAKFVVENARAIVDGHTANEVLVIAENERKKAVESSLAVYREQLAKAKAAINDIHNEAEAADKKQSEAQSLLQQIEITKPLFSFSKGTIEQPVISFTISNNGTIPIRRIYVHGKLQTPARAIPWVEADFNYEFPGGLEPREAKDLVLSPNMFGDWGKVPREAVQGALLSLKLTAFEDAAQKRIGDVSPSREQSELRKTALDEGIRTLEGKINDLEARIKKGD
jgi:hypothetical protein